MIRLIVAVVLFAATAHAAETPLVLPEDAALAPWVDIAAPYGLEPTHASDEPVRAVLEQEDLRWRLTAHRDGAVRTQVVPEPANADHRLEIVLVAVTLLQPSPETPARGETAETPPGRDMLLLEGEPDVAGPAGPGAWVGGGVRADLRAGRSQAAAFFVHGGPEFGSGVRVGVEVEGITAGRLANSSEAEPYTYWALGGGVGLWWAPRRPVAPLIGGRVGVMVRTYGDPVGELARVPGPSAAGEIAVSVGAGPVLRFVPHVRGVVDLLPAGTPDTTTFAVRGAVQFGIGVQIFSGKPTSE